MLEAGQKDHANKTFTVENVACFLSMSGFYSMSRNLLTCTFLPLFLAYDTCLI